MGKKTKRGKVNDRRMGWATSARLDVEASQAVTPFAEKILAEEHGLEHIPGARDDLCPKCKEGGNG